MHHAIKLYDPAPVLKACRELPSHKFGKAPFPNIPQKQATLPPGGTRPNVGRGRAIEVSNTYLFLIPIFPKCIPDCIPIFQKNIYPTLYQFSENAHPTLYQLRKLRKSIPFLISNRENRYRSLCQNREIRYTSQWHVPVPKICIVPPGHFSPFYETFDRFYPHARN